MTLVSSYLDYVRTVRRYSPLTVSSYGSVLEDFCSFIADGYEGELSDDVLLESLNVNVLRDYQVNLLDERGISARSVGLHLSVLSGFCRFLVRESRLKSNPVKLVPRPRQERKLPGFYKKEDMQAYFDATQEYASESMLRPLEESSDRKYAVKLYRRRLNRAVISTLYSLGIRRSELLLMRLGDVDFSRKVVKIHGKGDKTREIPLVSSLSKELFLYLKAVEVMVAGERSLSDMFFVTERGRALYPVYVDRLVKSEFGQFKAFSLRKSPHVLRHTVATELLDEGADLNSIKEMLGHSSLAATQVYTHNSIAKLKSIYESAHPRAKNGGKNGD